MAQLIAALDFPDTESLLACARRLAGAVPWVKAGLEAFTLAGPSLVQELKAMGFQVFLDLKFHDIPNTAAAAVRAAARTGASLLTVHCQGGEAMCRAAMEAARSAGPSRPLIFGVTALTSFGPGQMPGIEKDPGDFARDLALSAEVWGLDGVVCSGREAGYVRAHTKLRILCPGIRPAGSSADDQARVMTPAAAVAAGADFLVVGRPITRAADPAAAAAAVLAEMAAS